MTRYRATIRGDKAELRGYFTTPMLHVLREISEAVTPLGLLIATPAPDDYNPFRSEVTDSMVGAAMNAVVSYYAEQGITSDPQSVDYQALRAALETRAEPPSGVLRPRPPGPDLRARLHLRGRPVVVRPWDALQAPRAAHEGELMPDIKACDLTEPHRRHNWQESEEYNGFVPHMIPLYHVCPGVSRVEEDQGPAANCHLCVGAGGYEDHDGTWVECSCQRAARDTLAQLLWDATRAQDPSDFMPTVMTDLGSCQRVADALIERGVVPPRRT